MQPRGRLKKNIKKKLTNVSLCVCMSAGDSEMLVFAKVSSVHCSTSGLALGSPGCCLLFVVCHYARNTL